MKGTKLRGNMANKVDLSPADIAIAMDQGGSIKIAYRDVGGRAMQEQLAGSSQIFPDFVQVQTVFSVSYDNRT